jgi:hypothetical protein
LKCRYPPSIELTQFSSSLLCTEPDRPTAGGAAQREVQLNTAKPGQVQSDRKACARCGYAGLQIQTMTGSGSGFRRRHNNGNLGPPRVPTRVYTVGLHRPNPAPERPYFIGFFASQLSLAEREGLYPLIVRYSDFQGRRKVISQVLGSGTIEDVLGYLHDFPVGCLDPCISVIRGNLVACVPLDDVLHVDMHVDMASKR